MSYTERLYERFETLVEELGYELETFRMYRPQGVNIEGYIRFALSMDAASFQTHDDAIRHYLTRVARPLPLYSPLAQ